MKMYDNFKSGTVLLLLLAGSPLLHAQPHSPADLTAAAQQWLQQQAGADKSKVQVHPLDPRSASRSCETPLQFSLVNPKIQSQNSIKVLCDGIGGWQLYLSAKVSQMTDVLVSTKHLAPGTLLGADMVQIESRDQLFIRGATLTDASIVDGARIKRNLSQGQILTLRDLCLVCKGDQVTIEGISGSLVVATSGKALSDGSLGDNIEVQNSSSGRKIQASVTAVKKVAINL